MGLDATAARSCFAPFKQYLVQEKCSLLVAGLRPHVSEQLQWDSLSDDGPGPRNCGRWVISQVQSGQGLVLGITNSGRRL